MVELKGEIATPLLCGTIICIPIIVRLFFAISHYIPSEKFCDYQLDHIPLRQSVSCTSQGKAVAEVTTSIGQSNHPC